MAEELTVALGERSYPIMIGRGAVSSAWGGDLAGRRVLLVSDSNVAPLHADTCEQALSQANAEVTRAVVPAGEASKSITQFGALLDAAADAGIERGSCVVALGGGVVGDLAGFVAASYLRGVGLVQVPTSLLALVDSSVGGKTGINLDAGKNLVGAFYQPERVIADLDLLATLPEREYVSGLAEVVKYGVIWDGVLFAELEQNADALLAREDGVLERVVARCCEIKAEVVGMDERESGVRAILNFGHTLGHAIEAVSGYGKWLHGEAVAAGMDYAARLSVKAHGLDPAEADRIRALLERFGLPLASHADIQGLDWATLGKAMVSDKKTRGGVPRWVLAERLGGVVFGCTVDTDVLYQVFEEA